MGEHATRPMDRIFVGWDRPFLEPAVRAWLELVRERDLDTSRALIVLPGKRAVRRTQELIAELAPPSLAPPRVIPDTQLASALCSQRLALANPFERTLAWREALGKLTPRQRAALWAGDPSGSMPAALAKECARTFAELWADGRHASSLAELAERAAAFGDPARWHALAEVEAAYTALLVSFGRVDPAAAALHVLEQRLARADTLVFPFALVDPSRIERELLAQCGARAASFVFAPPSLAALFDELGCLDIDAWANRDVALARENWLVVDTPDDQALAVAAEVARRAGSIAASDVSIGVADAAVLPFLERRLAEFGCEPRWAGGTPLSQTRVGACLAALADWLAERRFEPYAALSRHADVEHAVSLAAGLAPGEWIAALDAYAQKCLPAFADGDWSGADAQTAAVLARGHAAWLGLAGELGTARALAFAQWAGEIARFVAAVWPSADVAARPADVAHRQREQSTALLARMLDACAVALDEARACRAATPMPAFDALRLFGERGLALEVAPQETRGPRPVIELFGWLELALDDAPELVVTGFNEGALPEAAPSGAWLGEGARRELGLGHEARRIARDTWALSAIAASRPRTLLISGRHNARRDPLVPSRFAFRCEPALALERVESAWPRAERARSIDGGAPAAFRPALAAPVPVTSIAVTAFREYLASPYLFYLKRVRRLATVDDRVEELDGGAFGTLAHDVLKSFGERDGLRACDDPGELTAFLRAELERLAVRRFGARPKAAVRLQIEALHRRLVHFARWQADQPALGWRIEHVEYAAQSTRIGPPGAELALLGRIDRIDFNERDGRWRVLDYKTSNAPESPRRAHRKNDAWIDLQLPLYREIAREVVPAGAPLEDGYVLLAKNGAEQMLALADWSDDEAVDALACARKVVASVTRGEFARVGERAPSEPIFAALCGFGLLEDDEGGEEGE